MAPELEASVRNDLLPVLAERTYEQEGVVLRVAEDGDGNAVFTRAWAGPDGTRAWEVLGVVRLREVAEAWDRVWGCEPRLSGMNRDDLCDGIGGVLDRTPSLVQVSLQAPRVWTPRRRVARVLLLGGPPGTESLRTDERRYPGSFWLYVACGVRLDGGVREEAIEICVPDRFGACWLDDAGRTDCTGGGAFLGRLQDDEWFLNAAYVLASCPWDQRMSERATTCEHDLRGARLVREGPAWCWEPIPVGVEPWDPFPSLDESKMDFL